MVSSGITLENLGYRQIPWVLPTPAIIGSNRSGSILKKMDADKIAWSHPVSASCLRRGGVSIFVSKDFLPV